MTETTTKERTLTIEVMTTSLRVFFGDTKDIDFERLESTKPPFVNWVGKSNDPDQNKESFIMDVCGEYTRLEQDRVFQWLMGNAHT